MFKRLFRLFVIFKRHNYMKLKAPTLRKESKVITAHGHDRVDPYYWIRLSDEQKNAETKDEVTKEVEKYLNEENEYTSKMLTHTDDLQETLFNEIIGRIKQTDMSVPYLDNEYFYLTRFEEGKEYAIHARKKGTLKAEEEVLIDENIQAEGYDFYSIGGRSISPDNKIMVYGEDRIGRRQYTLRFRDLATGIDMGEEIPNTTGVAVWANDNKTIFYTIKDNALRPFKIMKHILGTDNASDVVVHHEPDETFRAFVYKSKSKEYIIAGSWATLTQEFKYLDADKPEEPFSLFQERIKGLEYSIDHFEDYWYIRTNKDGATNYKLMKTSLDQTTVEHWEDVFPYDAEVFIEDVEIFADFLVISERANGNTRLRVIRWEDGNAHFVDFGQEAYMAYTSVNKAFDTGLLRLGFTSMITPNTIYDYNMNTRELTLLKQQEVVGGFNEEEYESEKLMVKARDGELVPLSIVYKKEFKPDGKNPLLLYAYGSYGHSIDPYFSSARLSLLDRGFSFAIAHVRGGQEMGRTWYDSGKLLVKKNTFNDFVDCGKALIEQSYVSENQLYAMGGSAGGLLMGAVVNSDSQLWRGVVAAVPFVDVVTTMLDESIPLTTGEFDEWGNPKIKEFYNYILSYSPYDNIHEMDYPHILVTSGYHDSQVQYWEPTKWVAKLREFNKAETNILLYTNMDSGHGGKSGRFRRFKETAMEYAFFLDLAGKS
ncbi:MAG: S9 family peptidase [Saprospiraceae bacterium]|nr:S9 family peptidase [Saprospiraceae bacterium]